MTYKIQNELRAVLISTIGMMQVCESAYRLDALACTGMCAEHDGNTRSKTDSDMVCARSLPLIVVLNLTAPASKAFLATSPLITMHD